mmetsp:Transcript_39399/g.39925  ORF Transcript_39399/g.39925 Transcript_39399/m.39925 type:complete len:225 (-) Transcript_39399:7-681(-)
MWTANRFVNSSSLLSSLFEGFVFCCSCSSNRVISVSGYSRFVGREEFPAESDRRASASPKLIDCAPTNSLLESPLTSGFTSVNSSEEFSRSLRFLLEFATNKSLLRPSFMVFCMGPASFKNCNKSSRTLPDSPPGGGWNGLGTDDEGFGSFSYCAPRVKPVRRALGSVYRVEEIPRDEEAFAAAASVLRLSTSSIASFAMAISWLVRAFSSRVTTLLDIFWPMV